MPTRSPEFNASSWVINHLCQLKKLDKQSWFLFIIFLFKFLRPPPGPILHKSTLVAILIPFKSSKPVVFDLSPWSGFNRRSHCGFLSSSRNRQSKTPEVCPTLRILITPIFFRRPRQTPTFNRDHKPLTTTNAPPCGQGFSIMMAGKPNEAVVPDAQVSHDDSTVLPEPVM